MDHEAYSWISRRAHELWQEEGHPNGRDREHWSQAAQEWNDLSVTRHSTVTPPRRTPIRKVLVVDDEPLIRFSTLDALENAGFEVMEAANAYEALVILNNSVVDAVFTDVNMPGATDGLALAKLVRARSPGIRVIVTSGHVRLGVYDLESGVSDRVPRRGVAYDIHGVSRAGRREYQRATAGKLMRGSSLICPMVSSVIYLAR